MCSRYAVRCCYCLSFIVLQKHPRFCQSSSKLSLFFLRIWFRHFSTLTLDSVWSFWLWHYVFCLLHSWKVLKIFGVPLYWPCLRVCTHLYCINNNHFVLASIAVVLILLGTSLDYGICAPERRTPEFRITNYFLALGTFIFSYGGHAVFPTIQVNLYKNYINFVISLY